MKLRCRSGDQKTTSSVENRSELKGDTSEEIKARSGTDTSYKSKRTLEPLPKFNQREVQPAP